MKGEKKTMKKIVSLMLAIVMMFSMSITAFAAEGSPEHKTPTLTVSAGVTKTYVKGATFTVKATAKSNDSCVPVLKYASSNANVIKVNQKGVVTIVGAGTAYVNVRATDPKDATKTVKKSIKVTINKAANGLKVSPATKTYTRRSTGLKTQSFTIKATGANGKVTYAMKNTAVKNVTVSSKGVVTLKKGTKKATYTIVVKAAGDKNHKAATKYVKVTVK